MFPSIRKLGNAHLGASTFFASSHPSESCGSNGLPLTPNSIRIYGRARMLNLINHPNLCTYIDVFRGKHERLIVVQEYYELNLRSAYKHYKIFQNEKKIVSLIHEVLQGLAYLNRFGTVCHNLSPETILIDPTSGVKLYDYGMYYMTEAGSSISFFIGKPKYLPPEVLVNFYLIEGQQPCTASGTGNPSWDSWSIGIIFLEILLNVTLFECEDLFGVMKQILTISLNEEEEDILSAIIDSHGLKYKLENISPNLQDFISKCLIIDSYHRPSPIELLNHNIFDCFTGSKTEIMLPHFPAIDPAISFIDISKFKSEVVVFEENFKDMLVNYPEGNDFQNEELKSPSFERIGRVDYLKEKNIRLIYHLWLLAGGNVEQELKKQKLIYTRPSIISLPRVVSKEGELFGGGFQRQERLPTSVIILPLESLRTRLAHIPPHKYYPLLIKGDCGNFDSETSLLPVVIREKNVEYQFHRILLFERLLKAYPFKLDLIAREARKDIPPFYRALIWASLLRVDGRIAELYEEIDKETPTTTDRQIEVDIPRCHQYDELLSSPQGHTKFTKILKAWVVSHPHLVYWQGLDSLCAPFLYLNFENEALAYACLSAFISKYLHNFFLRDNSAVIQEYLVKFSHLISFHDPSLFNHLQNIGFIPELYAIPWFLTMFTHVFPLHKIFLLWDTLLLGESSLPLCVGVAILKQLKDRLLQYGFNECILLFSDMPDIKMEQVVRDAVDLFCSTPASLTFRAHDKAQESKDSKSNHQQYNKDMVLDEISLHELKKELCGRISGVELLDLLFQERMNNGKPKVLLIDVRPQEEFTKGSLNDAVSMPFETLLPANDLNPTCLLEIEKAVKGKILVVMGSSTHHHKVLEIAHALLFHGFPRVCTLHKGIEVFRSSSHIIVPSSKVDRL